ncbi:MAG: hypothetical protein KAI25_09680, partial [Hyphomicrobiaceae bacterium]|nr:hypothetical protein [Hyphomicrobiaceae bacterium]
GWSASALAVPIASASASSFQVLSHLDQLTSAVAAAAAPAAPATLEIGVRSTVGAEIGRAAIVPVGALATGARLVILAALILYRRTHVALLVILSRQAGADHFTDNGTDGQFRFD